ncbi:uncharacterized protein OCT59_026080 [Rhizophagus irregularis]|uniref:Uncharacterized protein n=2 Tax=Rhizophagus irregularis TaxID=588596 RepID=A0A015L4Q0_RHIIW|nr:hypothetical protein RirG_048660 [Rhizophagus irregularis DAOM 197198w]UZO05739.1 hypothetical protein OCT59_026080 [Rhizophagus irregularis]
MDKRACWPCLPLWQGYQFFRKNLTKEDLDFVLWSNFVASLQLTVRMITYNTFKKMVDNLITLDIAKGALDLLRSVFLGFFDFIQIHDLEEEDKQIS